MGSASITRLVAICALGLAVHAAPVPAALKQDCKRAFKGLPLPAHRQWMERLAKSVPKGIVIEAAPFHALIERELRAFEEQLALRERVAKELAGHPGADSIALIRGALQALDKERTRLYERVEKVEEGYAEVFNRGYMASSEGARATRKTAAILIPLCRRLILRGEGTARIAARSLSKLSGGGDHARLVALARRDPLPLVRATAVDALASIRDAGSLAALREVLGSDRSPLVRARALGGLMNWKLAEVKADAIRALADSAWSVRALAVAICARGELVEAVGPLIEALAGEKGRLRQDIDDALRKLAGMQFFGDVALWRNWFASNRERLGKLAEERSYEEALGDPRGWERESSKGGDDEKRKGTTSAFYGIPTVSKRILFVIDISRSMESPADAKPSATRRKKTRFPAPRGGSKLDIAQWQLHRAVEALPKDATFDILVYSESYKSWQGKMTKASKGAKSKAHAFIESLVANGVTNIADSLDKAFELSGLGPVAGKGSADAPAADTLYLLSDGDPNRGRITDLEKLLEEIAARNPPGGLVIHAVGIGEAAGSSFLQALAERNGGRYVGYR